MQNSQDLDTSDWEKNENFYCLFVACFEIVQFTYFRWTITEDPDSSMTFHKIKEVSFQMSRFIRSLRDTINTLKSRVGR